MTDYRINRNMKKLSYAQVFKGKHNEIKWNIKKESSRREK